VEIIKLLLTLGKVEADSKGNITCVGRRCRDGENEHEAVVKLL
jgi:hypothetical protein